METGTRQFFSTGENQPSPNLSSVPVTNNKRLPFEEKCAHLNKNIIKPDHIICPFVIPGPQKTPSTKSVLLPATYLDHTATSRPLKNIESYITNNILPNYANTHTTVNRTAKQTTYLRHEAKYIIRNSLKLSEHQALIFTGHGATSAVNVLAYNLAQNFLRFGYQRIILFASISEHHSNLLPWRSIKNLKIVIVPVLENGDIDLDFIDNWFQMYKKSASGSDNQIQIQKTKFLATFTAASNVTGKFQNIEKICNFIKSKFTSNNRNESIDIFWDFATAGQYLDVNVNKLDAVFLSPHKILGGVNTPGILICHKSYLEGSFPLEKGGGAVFYVREGNVKYLKDVEMKEEAGTPDIIGSIRAGLVFKGWVRAYA